MSLNEDVPTMLTSSTTAVVLSRSATRLSADTTHYVHPLDSTNYDTIKSLSLIQLSQFHDTQWHFTQYIKFTL